MNRAELAEHMLQHEIECGQDVGFDWHYGDVQWWNDGDLRDAHRQDHIDRSEMVTHTHEEDV